MRKTLAIGATTAALLLTLGGAAWASGIQDNDVIDTDIVNTTDSFNITKSLNDHNLNIGGILTD